MELPKDYTAGLRVMKPRRIRYKYQAFEELAACVFRLAEYHKSKWVFVELS
jgi:hypothetical protein